MNVSAAYQIHRWADTELYEHVALHEHGDGECDVIANCGLMHPEAVEFADCIVAGNWAIVRGGNMDLTREVGATIKCEKCKQLKDLHLVTADTMELPPTGWEFTVHDGWRCDECAGKPDDVFFWNGNDRGTCENCGALQPIAVMAN